MKTKLLQGLLLCVALISVSHAEITPRIVGGAESDQAYSWMVSIQYRSSGQHFCGGTLIANNWVVTAAHCTENTPASAMQVVIGIQNLSEPNVDETYRVSAIYDHADYNFPKELNNDISLLKLSGETSLAPIETISLNDFNNIATGELLKTIGWGALEEFDSELETGNFPEALNEVELPLVSPATCRAAYPFEFGASENPLCAGFVEGGKDSCQGDSGGPLIIEQDGTPYLVGVVSWGYGCARAGSYGVYSNVSAYTDWLDQYLSDEYVEYSLNFETLYAGEGKETLFPITLTNYGERPMTVNGIEVNIGDEFLSLEGNTCLNSQLANGESCKINALVNIEQSANHSSRIKVSAETDLSFDLLVDILPAVDFPFTDDLAVDWFSGGANQWIKEGSNCELTSGAIDHNQSSVLLGYYTGTDIPVVDIDVSSEEGWDGLYLSFDGDNKSALLSGSFADQLTLLDEELDNSEHRVEFEYYKDDSVHGGLDQAKITALQLGETIISSDCSVTGDSRVQTPEEPNTEPETPEPEVPETETPDPEVPEEETPDNSIISGSGGSGGGSAFYLLLPLLLINFKRKKLA